MFMLLFCCFWSICLLYSFALTDVLYMLIICLCSVDLYIYISFWLLCTFCFVDPLFVMVNCLNYFFLR
jgi:hypothetical protein